MFNNGYGYYQVFIKHNNAWVFKDQYHTASEALRSVRCAQAEGFQAELHNDTENPVEREFT